LGDNRKRRAKAVGLFSGGLDSILATRLLAEQSVEIVLLHFLMPWQTREEDGAKAGISAEGLGQPLEYIPLQDDYIAMLKAPTHGYGKNINPCIDCHIFMLSRARERMERDKADLVFTGEVLGERPMSQRKPMLDIIEQESGLSGRLLRPLSAKLLPETIPERVGLIEREKLLDISGRNRKPQLDLARKYGIMEFPPPGGGCLLTDRGYAGRVRESLAHGEETVRHFRLLRLGRHFRLPSGAKAVVGRNQGDNEKIAQLGESGEILMDPAVVMGPTVLLLNIKDLPADICSAANLCALYSDAKGPATVKYWNVGETQFQEINPSLIEESLLKSMHI
jgi:tRNA-specific 2-thiouridylase